MWLVYFICEYNKYSFSECRPEQYGRYLMRQYIPLYMACGVILMSTSLGLLTAGQELLHAPNVFVNKKKRREIPEVEDPDYVLRNSQEFNKQSLFRRLAKVSRRYHDIMQAKSSSTSAGDDSYNIVTHK